MAKRCPSLAYYPYHVMLHIRADAEQWPSQYTTSRCTAGSMENIGDVQGEILVIFVILLVISYRINKVISK